MATSVNRKMALREADKCAETPEIMNELLLQMLLEMEARTRKALELAKELEELVRSFAAAAGDATKVTEESIGQSVQPRKYPASRPRKSKEVNKKRLRKM